MTDLTERTLGRGFGLLGGVLILVAAVVALLVGAADLVLGRSFGALNAASEAILLFVVGALALFFTWLAHTSWSGRPITSGILLVVVAVIGWGMLGLGTNIIALVGSLFVFLAGVLYLIPPAVSGVRTLATA
jgi:hypothetical protein